MNRKIAAGAGGGLVAGLAFDIVMRMIPERGAGSMLAFAATTVHAANPLAGWIVYPVYGVLIGAFFGWLLHAQTLDARPALVWGGVYGLGWWIIAGLILVPALRATWPFSIAAIDQAREVAFPLLVGHVVYGVILGLAWSQITRWTAFGQRPGAPSITHRRAA